MGHALIMPEEQAQTPKQQILSKLLGAQRYMVSASDDLQRIKLANRTPEFLELQQLSVRLNNLMRNIGRLEL